MNTLETLFNELLSHINVNEVKDHPNILIAARLWDDERYNAAKVCYKFMRKIDDYVDDRKSLGISIGEGEKADMEAEVHNWIKELYHDYNSADELSEIKQVIQKFKIPAVLFQDFASAMIYDINNTGFETISDFINYSEGASVAPASIFVHLCCLKKIGDQYVEPEYSVQDCARPCALFSYLVHIIRDFEKDQRNNLNYFAEDVLRRHRTNHDEIKKIALGEMNATYEFRNVIQHYYFLADKYRRKTLEKLRFLEHKLDPRYVLSLKVIFELYLMVFERINPQKGTFSTTELTPNVDEILGRVYQIIEEMRV